MSRLISVFCAVLIALCACSSNAAPESESNENNQSRESSFTPETCLTTSSSAELTVCRSQETQKLKQLNKKLIAVLEHTPERIKSLGNESLDIEMKEAGASSFSSVISEYDESKSKICLWASSPSYGGAGRNQQYIACMYALEKALNEVLDMNPF